MAPRKNQRMQRKSSYAPRKYANATQSRKDSNTAHSCWKETVTKTAPTCNHKMAKNKTNSQKNLNLGFDPINLV